MKKSLNAIKWHLITLNTRSYSRCYSFNWGVEVNSLTKRMIRTEHSIISALIAYRLLFLDQSSISSSLRVVSIYYRVFNTTIKQSMFLFPKCFMQFHCVMHTTCVVYCGTASPGRSVASVD